MQVDEYHVSYLTARCGKTQAEAQAMVDAFKKSNLGKKFDWTRDHTDVENSTHSMITVAILKGVG
jgi:hypothetical protein